MVSAVDFHQVPGGDVGIYLGSGDVYVTQHGLYRTEIGAAFQQVRGKGVAELVGADGFGNFGFGRIFLHNLPETLTRHRFPAIGQEQVGFSRGCFVRPDLIDVFF
jgi:hypothetical protein